MHKPLKMKRTKELIEVRISTNLVNLVFLSSGSSAWPETLNWKFPMKKRRNRHPAIKSHSAAEKGKRDLILEAFKESAGLQEMQT